MTIHEKKWVSLQILCALDQLHSIVVGGSIDNWHGTIKPENILIDSFSFVYLTDKLFGKYQMP